MSPLDTAKAEEEIKAAVASVARDTFIARFTLFFLKPMQYVLTMAYFAALLYGATWIVVLALRHAGVIH